MKRLLMACLCGMAAFSACKKKDKDSAIPTPNPTPGSNKINLISRAWKMTYSFVAPPGIPDTGGRFITDLFGIRDSCNRDDLLRFTKTATYTLTEGATRCRPTAPSTLETGTWSFINNEAGISQKHIGLIPHPSRPGSDTTATIEVISTLDSVTESRLRLTYPMQVNGVTYTVSSGFTGQ